ncbi:MAG: hypothetical protein RBR47_13160 [Bacteroidales bacterium]|nr:hypothetical protein [Bacteroidales bacterium]NCU35852.1 hypothetical protein [Candidatus Falkowbacteria bacterium]
MAIKIYWTERTMKRNMNILKCFLLILTAIHPLISHAHSYCEFIQNLKDYQDSEKIQLSGDCHVLDTNTFAIQTYLSLFDKIEVEEGFKIGVYYFDNFLDGNPYLYAINKNGKFKGENNEITYEFLNQHESRAKNHIRPFDSEIGFLQYLFFTEMGEQFALKWHANYNEKYVICSQDQIDEIINEFRKYKEHVETEEEEKELPLFFADSTELSNIKQINPTIKVELEKDFCTITWIENRTHRGIYRCKYMIRRQFPFKIKMIDEDQLLQISIGFVY